MGSYELDRLNNSEFEHLVQALSTKIFNYKNIVFGSGPDGAREATFEGSCTIDEKTINGYHVIQAKFKECSSPKDNQDWQWAKNEFKKEMDKFKNKERDLRTPDVYLFFTNIRFTSVSKTGTRDKIEEFKKTYFSLISNIRIYGYDEICKFLDNNRDVATSYASFILPGDILQELYKSIQVNDKRDQNILYRFLNKEFDEDLYSKLEQANELTDKKINLEKVFVDLSISKDNLFEDDSHKFVQFCIDIGNRIWKDEQYKMVFIGGPGQGKSTVTQFLTQIYRVYLLKSFNKKLPKNVKNFIDYNIDIDKHPKCYRFPIRIILSDYSEWLNDQKKSGLSYTLLSYIQHRIEYRADEKFSEFGNFRVLLEKLSFLFIFDGLDEVPSTSNRGEVITEIDTFINYELKTVNCDAVIIATTRPQGYTNEFDQSKFQHFRLNDLDDETCLTYLNNLVSNTANSDDDKTRQLKILKEALDAEVTSNIMRTPLQATIMAILVKSGGKPSKDKFSLFNDYYQTMLKREKQKHVLKIISEHEDYINEIHYLLGNKLQLSSQKQENSSAYLDKDNFKNLVEEYFTEQELDSRDKEKYTHEIMEAITERLVFITENQDNKIGFAIRSTQEYFSAMYNVHNRSDKDVVDNIKTISESIYWRNVFIFMIGYMAKNKGYLLDSLDSYLGELNGSDIEFKDVSLSKSSKYGALLSLEILSESILSNWPKQENKFIKHLQELTYIVAPENIEHLLQKLRSKIVNNGMTDILLIGVQSSELVNRMSSWNIIAVLSENNKDLLDKFHNQWPVDEKEELYCLKLFVENSVFSEFIFERYYKYFDWKYYKNLPNVIFEFGFLEAVARSRSIHLNNKAKNFLIEYLFLNFREHYRGEDISKLFLTLLNIEMDMIYDSLIEEDKILTQIGSFDVSIKNIKDLRQNKLLIELCKATYQNNELSLLYNFFHHLLEPTSKTLNDLFCVIKSKIQYIDNYSSLVFNWQLKYIVNNLREEISDDEIVQTMSNWGNSFEEFKIYEKGLNDTNKILENIDFVNFHYEHDDENISMSFMDFYEKYKKNTNLSNLLLMVFINEVVWLNSKNIKNERHKEVIQIIIKIINNNNNSKQLRALSLVLVMALIEKKDIFKLDIDYSVLDTDYTVSILPRNFIVLAIKNIIDTINFNQEENALIKQAFDIVIRERRFRINDDVVIGYDILFDLDYSDEELKTYGYLLSLISPKVHKDNEKMRMITKFLIFRAKLNSDIFKYTQDIISMYSLKGDLIEHLLLEMYKCIKKDTIESCILASKYENTFQNMFENKVIEL
ncbi:MAG: hypothetical protein PHI79_04490 [Sulfurovaceae bacterium]|nr:hypothetical protein [Sulfurovaceae bacterium]